jgi:excisionase family DNA binding protein
MDQHDQNERLLTLDQVAERLGVRPRFVRGLVAERRITFYKVGRYVRFSERDIADYLAAARIEAATNAPRTRRRIHPSGARHRRLRMHPKEST